MMAVTRLIFALVFGLLSFQTHNEEQDLPEWTNAPDEPNLFVVQTEDFSTHYDVTNGLLPAVRSGVVRWAQEHCGSDCTQVIESIPIEEFSDLIHQNQEIIHESRRIYDAETAKRLDAEYDIFYRGYVRVNINETFQNRIQKLLDKQRLRNRLCMTLIAALATFGLAAIGWSYLFANRVSRGFYIGRLRWVAGSMLIALVLICYGISRMLF